jgi:hypothetical protein
MNNQIEIQASIQIGKVKHTFTFESIEGLDKWAAELGWSIYQAGGRAGFVLRSAGKDAEAYGVVHHHKTKYKTEKA